jgi:selenocysteine lyase/cysteine desulfurase
MLTCQKNLFSIPPDEHYINCAYMSPLLKSVEEAGIIGMQKKRNPAHLTADDFFDDVAKLKSLFGKLVNAAPGRVAVIPSVSYGMGIVIHNLKPRGRKKLITVHEEFPSAVFSLQRMCKEHDLQLEFVSPPADNKDRGKRWNEKILEAIDADTALVNLSSVHWADGTLFDMEAIGNRAREVGALFVVDGTQSVGALPFDVKACKVDALICAGYKWLLGPYTTGYAYFGEHFDGGTPLEESWINREGSSKFRSLADYEQEYTPLAGRYSMGQSSNFINVPMQVAALEQILAWEPSAIQDYCRSITQNLVSRLKEQGYQVDDDHYRSGHIIGCRLPAHLDMDEIQQRLIEKKITVSFRGSAIRLSPHLYNDEADMEMLISALL